MLLWNLLKIEIPKEVFKKMAHWSCPSGDYEVEGSDEDVEEKQKAHIQNFGHDENHSNVSQAKGSFDKGHDKFEKMEEKIKSLLEDIT